MVLALGSWRFYDVEEIVQNRRHHRIGKPITRGYSDAEIAEMVRRLYVPEPGAIRSRVQPRFLPNTADVFPDMKGGEYIAGRLARSRQENGTILGKLTEEALKSYGKIPSVERKITTKYGWTVTAGKKIPLTVLFAPRGGWNTSPHPTHTTAASHAQTSVPGYPQAGPAPRSPANSDNYENLVNWSPPASPTPPAVTQDRGKAPEYSETAPVRALGQDPGSSANETVSSYTWPPNSGDPQFGSVSDYPANTSVASYTMPYRFHPPTDTHEPDSHDARGQAAAYAEFLSEGGGMSPSHTRIETQSAQHAQRPFPQPPKKKKNKIRTPRH